MAENKTEEGFERAMFSRKPGGVELRVWIEADLVNVLDAEVGTNDKVGTR